MNFCQFVITRLLNIISKLYHNASARVTLIIDNSRYAIAFLFGLTIIIGIGGNILIGSANDAGDDGAFYYDAAENLKEGRGFTSDIKSYWLDNWHESVLQLGTHRNHFRFDLRRDLLQLRGHCPADDADAVAATQNRLLQPRE